MKIILIGPPGAGKGTQAGKLALRWSVPRITTGDLFRRAVQNQTPLGVKVAGILKEGSLVPDSLVLEIMGERMAEPDCKKGFILDGFPRTVGQAEGLEKWLAKKGIRLDHVVAIHIPEEEAVVRNTGRRQCSRCGAAYHLQWNPPKQEGVCDTCGGALKQRDDDREATVRHRLQVYAKETKPLFPFYEKRNLLKRVDGLQTPEAVFQEICSLTK